MCNVCNGTHTYVASGSGFALVATCYECGPMPKEQVASELNSFLERLAAAKEYYANGGTGEWKSEAKS